MRRSEPGKSSGQSVGLKGENSAERKTCMKKRSASISAPSLPSSEFLPVYFVDLKHSEEDKEVDVNFYSIQRKFSGKKMRDQIQTITTKESSHAETSELDAHVQSTCFEQDLPKHKSTKKSSKRGRDNNSGVQTLLLPNLASAVCRTNKNQHVEMTSESDIVFKGKRKQISSNTNSKSVAKLISDVKKDEKHSADTDEESSKEVRKSKFLKDVSKQDKRQFSGSKNGSNISAFLSVEEQETNVLDNFTDKMTSPQGEKKKNSNDTSPIIDTSTPNTTTKKKAEFFPDLALSPELLKPKSSKLPLLTGGFVPHSKRRLTSSFSPKNLDCLEEAESSLNSSLNKSLGASTNSSSPGISSPNSCFSNKDTSSAHFYSNPTYSFSSLGNSSILASPKTPESFNSSEMKQWKLRRGMSDIGPQRYKNFNWRESVQGSSDTLHASLLDKPPYARLRERLLDNRHLLPKRNLHEHIEKYHSFQHRSHLAKHTNWKSDFLNQCWSLENTFIDSHCHLDFLFDRLPFNGNFQNYYRKNLDTFPSNFAGCVAVFCEPKSFTSEGLWKVLVNDDMVWLAMGCHPKKATGFDDAAENGLSNCLKHPKVVAVGEIGLDYSGRFIESAEIQKKVFVCQIKMALAVKKPLVIHCRDAQDDCLQILKKHVPSDYRIHCHCFTKSFKLAKEWLALFPNLYIGLTPLVTYPSAKEVHDTARNIPLERLLLETDTPYFVPKFVPRGMMKFSHPGLAISVAFEVAKLKGTCVEKVLQHCLENTKKMYGI